MVYEFTIPTLPATVSLSLRPASTSIMLDHDQVYAFDGAGRLLTAFSDERLYKRGLDHRMLVKWRPDAPGRPEHIHRDVPDDEKRRLVDTVRNVIGQIVDALPPNAPPGCRERLEHIVQWDSRAYAADRERFAQVYQPVPILPPDQYLALVLQATEGCHYNHCTFCRFYRRRRFRIKSTAEFATHITAAREFLGAGLGMRRTIFLADANALVAPTERLINFFDAINNAFEVAPAQLNGAALADWRAQHPLGVTGIYSFLDAFTGKRKTREEFETLVTRGLRRVYIGMESGHTPLLEFLCKPSMPDDVRAVVQAAKVAGANVGVIIMLGIGGERYAAGHVADTIAVVNSLGLDASDILYFSPFVDEPGSEYDALTSAAGVRPLTGEEIQDQGRAIRAGLRFVALPRISTYDVREFIY
jgi:hypothetical protein